MTGWARSMWRCYEPVHGCVYFAPEALTSSARAGYRGFWMAYFAQRLAPLGEVGPQVAAAACFGFHLSRVSRALPDAWGYAGRDVALGTRLDAARAALRAVLGAAVEPDGLGEAADLAWRAAAAADTGGRVLAAANQALPRPGDRLGALWQATTTLREHRGDGHVAVLVASGISAVESHLLKVASGETDPDLLRTSRAWPDDDWSAAAESLRGRGWVDADGALTAKGAAARDEVERRTDEVAERPWTALGDAGTERLARLLGPFAAAVVASGAFPLPNPVGVPADAGKL